jgi:hypothetical protein
MATKRKGHLRPITQALALLKKSTIFVTVAMGSTITNYYTIDERDRRELVRLLKQVNAASGTTDEKTAKKRAATIRRKARAR